MLLRIRTIFDGYKFHSIKQEDKYVVLRFNCMNDLDAGKLLLAANNIENIVDEQNANIYVNV